MISINTDSIPGDETPPVANPSECRPRLPSRGLLIFTCITCAIPKIMALMAPFPVKIRAAAALAALWLLASCDQGRQFSGMVVSIADGDTLTVLHAGKQERVRLYGVDCPEKKQPFGTRARQLTGQLAFHKWLRCA